MPINVNFYYRHTINYYSAKMLSCTIFQIPIFHPLWCSKKIELLKISSNLTGPTDVTTITYGKAPVLAATWTQLKRLKLTRAGSALASNKIWAAS